MKRAPCLLSYCVLLIGCRSASLPATTDPALDNLLTKINERLQLMEAVARVKYQKKLPIADAAREEEMLERLAVKAKDVSFDPQSARWFFAAQIQAAKMVQEHHVQRWSAQAEPDPGNAEDLAVLRDRIDRLNDELIAALVEFRKHSFKRAQIEERAQRLIQGPGIDSTVRITAIRPLLERE